jgi:hypothetical protein
MIFSALCSAVQGAFSKPRYLAVSLPISVSTRLSGAKVSPNPSGSSRRSTDVPGVDSNSSKPRVATMRRPVDIC